MGHFKWTVLKLVYGPFSTCIFECNMDPFKNVLDCWAYWDHFRIYFGCWLMWKTIFNVLIYLGPLINIILYFLPLANMSGFLTYRDPSEKYVQPFELQGSFRNTCSEFWTFYYMPSPTGIILFQDF